MCDFGFYVQTGFLCHAFQRIIPHNFFTEMLYYYSATVSIVFITYFLFVIFKRKDDEEDFLFRKHTESSCFENNVQQIFVQENDIEKCREKKSEEIIEPDDQERSETYEQDI